jgi:polar amino acid transport system permease protein
MRFFRPRVTIVGFVELTRAGQLMANVTVQPMIIYPLVAAMYFALCWPLSVAAGRLERRPDLRG